MVNKNKAALVFKFTWRLVKSLMLFIFRIIKRITPLIFSLIGFAIYFIVEFFFHYADEVNENDSPQFLRDEDDNVFVNDQHKFGFELDSSHKYHNRP